MKNSLLLGRARALLLLLLVVATTGCDGTFLVLAEPQSLGEVPVGSSADSLVVITSETRARVRGLEVVEEENCNAEETVPLWLQANGEGFLTVSEENRGTVPVTLTPLAAGEFCATFFVFQDRRELEFAPEDRPADHVTEVCGIAVDGAGSIVLAVEPLEPGTVGVPGTFVITASNVGDGPLTIDGASGDPGDNVGEIDIDSSTLPAVLGPNETVDLPTTLTPDATGDWSATMTVTSDDPAQPAASIEVTSSSAYPDTDVSAGGATTPWSIGVGTVQGLCLQAGQEARVPVTVTRGSGPGLASISAITVAQEQNATITVDPTSLPTMDASDSETFEVVITATSAGDVAGVITLRDVDQGSQFVLTLLGTATSPGAPLQVDAPVNLGVFPDATSSSASVPVTNVAPLPIVVLGASVVDGTEVNVDSITTGPPNPATLEACATSLVPVTFTPLCTPDQFDDCVSATDSSVTQYDFTFDIDIEWDPEPSVAGTANTVAQVDGLVDEAVPLAPKIVIGTATPLLDAPVGVTAAAIVEVTNDGNAPLIIESPVVNTESNVAVGLADALTYPLSIPPGGFYGLPLNVVVASPGAFGASGTINSNDPALPGANFAISGTGAETAHIRLRRDLGPSLLGTDVLPASAGAPFTVTYTIENPGLLDLTVSEPLFFQETNVAVSLATPPASTTIPSGGSSDFDLLITPSGSGVFTWSFELSIPNDSANASPFALHVTGPVVGAPTLTVPASLAMGNIPTLQGTLVTIPLTNGGGLPLNVTTLTLDTPTNATVVITPSITLPLVIDAAATSNVVVEVTPSANGAVDFTFVGDTDSTATPTFSVPVTATAQSANVQVSYPTPPNVQPGVQTSTTFALENVGNLDLQVSAVTVGSTNNVTGVTVGALSVNPVPAGGGTATVTVDWTGSSAGTASYALEIQSNAINGSFTTWPFSTSVVAVPDIAVTVDGVPASSGTGLAIPSLLPPSVASSVSVGITNNGTAPLTISSAGTSSAAQATVGIAVPPASPVQPGTTAVFEVQVTPQSLTGTPYSFDLTIESDDPDTATFVVPVSGTPSFVEIGVDAGSGGLTSGDLVPVTGMVAGVPFPVTITITNSGTGDLTLFGASVGNEQGSSSTITQPPATLPGGQSTTVTLTITPLVGGGLSSTPISIGNTDPTDNEDPFVLTFVGTAGGPEIGLSRANPIETGTTETLAPAGPGSIPLTYTITNSGLDALTLSAPTFASQSNVSGVVTGALGTTTVGPGSQTTFEVTLTPNGTGSYSWSLDIEILNSDADENPFVFTVAGSVADPPILSAPLNQAMGDVLTQQANAEALAITNLGGQDLTISALSISGLNNTTATFDPTPVLPLVIPGGQGVSIDLDVSPTADGPIGFSVDMDTDDPNATQVSIPFTGTGVTPDIVVQDAGGAALANGATFNAGNADLGVTQSTTFLIQSVGTGDLTLGASSVANGVNVGNLGISVAPATPVAPGTNTAVTVSWEATAAGPASFDLLIPSDDGDTPLFALTVSAIGVGVPEAVVSIAGFTGSIYTLPAGAVAGIQNTVDVTVTNPGTDLLVINSVQVTDVSGVTTIAPTGVPASLAVNASAVFTIPFTATSATGGSFEFEFDVNTNDPFSPATRTVLGTAAAAELDIAINSLPVATGGTHALTADVLMGTSTTVTLQLSNPGTAELTFNTIAISAASNATATPGTLPASLPIGGNGSVEVTITPSSAGAFSAQVRIESGDLDENPYFVTITGTAVTPEIDVAESGQASTPDGGSITVAGSVSLGTTATLPLVISNNGAGVLDVTGVTPGALNNVGVSVSFTTVTIAAQAATTLNVDMTPSAAGPFSFTLQIGNTDLNEDPYDLTITGTCVGIPDIDVLVAGQAVADATGFALPNPVLAGTTEVIEVLVQNTGTDVLAMSATTLANVQGATVTGSLGATTLAIGTSQTFNLNVTPTPGLNSWSFDLAIPSNDPDAESVYEIAFSGTTVEPDLELQVDGSAVTDGASTTLANATAAGAPVIIPVTLENFGSTTLTINSATVSVSAGTATAQILNPPTSLGAGASTVMNVEVTASERGIYTLVVTVNSNDPTDGSYAITLEGLAISPEIDVTQGGATVPVGGTFTVFGLIPDGVPTTLTFPYDNDVGTDTLTISSVTTTNPSNVSLGTPSFAATLLPGQDNAVQLAATPGAAGPYSFVVSIANNDLDEGTYTFTVTGNAGADPEIDVVYDGVSYADGATIDVGGIVEGQLTVAELDVDAVGTGILNVTAVNLSNQVNVTASVSADPTGAIAGGTSADLDLDLTGAAPGGFTVQVTIDNDDSNEDPYDLTIVGSVVAEFSCQGLPEIVDTEPNSLFGEPSQSIAGQTTPFCVSGSLICDGGQPFNQDVFSGFTVATSGSLNYELMWNDPTVDAGLASFDSTTFSSQIIEQPGVGGPETGSATFSASSTYQFHVFCLGLQTTPFDYYLLIYP